MIGVDDGIASGNANVADILFLVAVILAALAALTAVPRAAATRPTVVWTPVLGWAAIACASLAFLLL